MNLNQVTVASTDVARAIEFYSKLGLKLIVNSLFYAGPNRLNPPWRVA